MENNKGENPGPKCEGAGGMGGEVRDSLISSLSVFLSLAGFSSFPSLILIGNVIAEPPLRFQASWGDNSCSVTRAGGTLEKMPPLPQRITESLGRTGRKECQMRVLGNVTS